MNLFDLTHNPVMILLAVCTGLDMLLGLLRGVKERKFNSSVGIDGGIRKAAMMFCTLGLAWMDSIVQLNLVGLLPEGLQELLSLPKIGLCELFGLLFVLFESASILKNLLLCGAPVPSAIRKCILEFMAGMTCELPDEKEREALDK